MGRHLVTSLRTGALRAELADGMLHDIRLGDTVVLDAVHVAVRDPDWGTVPPVLDEITVNTARAGFTVGYRAHHENGFFWRGSITGDRGRIVFAMEGVAVRTLRANRIGFCLLHPQDLAGVPVTVRTPQGPVDTRFPEEISPHQPFPELTGLTYLGLDIDLSGDLFETEDQRNWTDPSFKTYSTPLRLGFPRTFPADAPVRQRVELGCRETETTRTRRRSREPVRVRVGVRPQGPLAPLGLVLPSQGGPLTPEEAEALAACRPSHLWVETDLRPAAGPTAWHAALYRADHDAALLDVPLHIEAVCDEPGDLAPLVDAIAAATARVDRLMVFDSTSTTHRVTAVAARELLNRAGLEQVEVGGGSRANFAELNRADLSGVPLDVLCYPINPQVHAFDDDSVMGTLRAQPATLAQGRSMAHGRPVAVGPVTLRPRFNPVATGPQPPTPVDLLPPQVDPRQAGWFTAAWAVGCRSALAGAESVTLFEATGWRGLVARAAHPAPHHPHHPLFPAEPGVPFPVHGVLAALSDWAGHPVLAATTGDRRVAALAVALDDGTAAAMANLTPEPVRVSVDHAGRHPDLVTPVGGEPVGGAPLLTLGPYRVVVCRWLSGPPSGTVR